LTSAVFANVGGAFFDLLFLFFGRFASKHFKIVRCPNLSLLHQKFAV
jgi:hypothetical protein